MNFFLPECICTGKYKLELRKNADPHPTQKYGAFMKITEEHLNLE